MELIETGATVGGVALNTGDILVTIDASGSVGNNNLSVTAQDIFALNITATTFGSGTAAATASIGSGTLHVTPSSVVRLKRISRFFLIHVHMQ